MLQMQRFSMDLVRYAEIIRLISQNKSTTYTKASNAINFFHDSTLEWWKQNWFWSTGGAVMPSTLLHKEC
ncbi:hypothetical protein NHH15_14565 [Lachnospiraceae bacterium PAL113]|uniref:Uncharacterized protein n=1 Tax=Aequitasia blattaphilus TaxID=2949332 RepID=A0ABT1EFB2_9FIRM|nr:hypothetical protein [Aequitasia blattaphilus]MCR8616262.1 hypothetical protein [Aequitasia blattaphilus]